MAAAIPLCDLPFRLNLFSAVFGALAVSMLFRLVSCVLYEFSQSDKLLSLELYRCDEDASDARSSSPSGIAPAESDTTEYMCATLGGLLAAFSFAFGAPFWSASVSLHPQTFDMFLVFLVAGCFARYVFTGSIVNCVLVMFLSGLGIVESVVFVVASPVILFSLFKAATRHRQLSEPFVLLVLISGLLGVGGGIAALVACAGASTALDLHWLEAHIHDMARFHWTELAQGVPHLGWLLVVVETIVPLVAIVCGAPRFLNGHESFSRWMWGLLNAIFTPVVAVCLLGLTHTPWGLARQSFYLPVFGSLASSITVGILFAYWSLSRTTPHYNSEIQDYAPPSLAHRTLYCSMIVILLTVVLLAPLYNFRDADGRSGSFADSLACELIASTGNANCLVTDGTLDMHVLIQNHLQKRKLTVVPGNPDSDQLEPCSAVVTDSRATASRTGQPQKEPASVFIERWLRAKPDACGQVAVMVQPSFWTRAGLCAIPNGLVYLGSANVQSIDGPQLLREHEILWSSLTPILPHDKKLLPALDNMLTCASRQASRVANDLGVFLEDRGCLKEAVRAYEQAQGIDPDNLSASFNQYGLLLRYASLGSSAEQARLIQCINERTSRGFMFKRCVTLYGSLHSQPADLLEHNALAAQHPLLIQWVAYCQSLAAAELCPSLLTGAARDSDAALAKVVLALRAGDKVDAETRLRSILKADPMNLSGWSILTDLLLNSGRTNEIAVVVLPAMRAAAGEKGHELVDIAEGLLSLHQAPPRYRDARTFFKRALAHHPDLKEAQDQLLQTDCSLGDTECIETDAGEILKTDANNSAANAILGGLRLSQKRYSESEKHLRRSVATFPSAGALNDLAELQRVTNKLADAEKSARNALKLNPNFYQAWDTLGNVLAGQNRLNEAHAAMRCALSICSSDPRLYINLARLNLRLNRINDARQVLALAAPMVAKGMPSVGKEFEALSRELDSLAASR